MRTTTTSPSTSPTFLLGIVLFVGILLRVLGIGYGIGFHPDERHIVMTVERLSWNALNPGSFAYGSLLFYLLRLVSGLLSYFHPSFHSYDSLFVLGRGLSILFYVGTGIALWHLAVQVTGSVTVAFFAVFFLTFNSFHIQLSHFITADTLLTFLTVLFFLLIAKGISNQRQVMTYGAAIILGMAFATKSSALSLLPVLLVGTVLVSWNGKSSLLRVVTSLITVSAISLAVFICCEPFAIFDFQKFFSDNWNEIQMVRGVSRRPYTLQYVGTASYLYALQQMARFTMWWPLFCAGAVGQLFLLRKQPRSVPFLIVGWVILFFLAVAHHEVKFPRYLLPLYPFFMLGAACALVKLYEVLRTVFASRMIAALPIFLVAGATALHGLAHLNVLLSEHPYIAASRWIASHIPQDSVLLGVPWDDKLPISVSGVQMPSYQMDGKDFDLPLFDNGGPALLHRFALLLEKGDYLILPTSRAARAVLQDPTLHPEAATLFEMLFSGSLGYRVIQTIGTTPAIGSLEFPDAAADESLSVYDHPTVIILKNQQRHSQHQLLQQLHARSYASPRSLREILDVTTDATNLVTKIGSAPFPWASMVSWFFTLELLGIFGFLLLLPLSVHQAVMVGRPFGVLAFALGCFAVQRLCMLELDGSRVKVWLIFALSVAFLIARRKLKRLSPFCLKRIARSYGATTLFWIGTVLTLLLVKMCTPEIYWGEKPMDSTFLRYFTRETSYLFTEPWAAGFELDYYYLGFYLYGLLHKCTFIPPGIGFNLALVTTGGLFALSSAALIRSLTKSKQGGYYGALALLLFGNFEIVRLICFGKAPLSFDTFWASTRLYHSPAFTEYPLWSLLFGDLHPHLMALPFSLLLITFLARALYASPISQKRLGLLVVAGISVGSLRGLNAWDWITYSALSLFLLFAVSAKQEGRKSTQSVLHSSWDITCDLLALCVPALLVSWLFLPGHKSARIIPFGWVHPDEFNQIGQILSMHGLWIIPFTVLNLSLLWQHRSAIHIKEGIYALLLGSPPLLLIVLALSGGRLSIGHSSITPLAQIPWSLVLLSSIGAAGAALLTRCGVSRHVNLAAFLVIAAYYLLTGAELLFLFDRMNTIFKLYYPLWNLFGVGAIVLSVLAMKRPVRFAMLPAFGSIGVAFGIGILASGLALWSMTSFNRVQGPKPSLDGIAYLPRLSPEQFALITWMNSNIVGTWVTAEAHGPSYQEYSKITMHTGLPTVMGWSYHVQQRGVPASEVEKRKNDLARLYHTVSAEEAFAVCSRYNVTYVVVGASERAAYGEQAGLHLQHASQYFRRVALFGSTSLYQVQYPTERAL